MRDVSTYSVKSRTFAVLKQGLGFVDVTFLVRVASTGINTETKKELDHKNKRIWSLNQDVLVDFLVAAGLTVRYYDPEEKQWMDQSFLYGVVVAPGARDGAWGMPTLEEFETSYLAVK